MRDKNEGHGVYRDATKADGRVQEDSPRDPENMGLLLSELSSRVVDILATGDK